MQYLDAGSLQGIAYRVDATIKTVAQGLLQYRVEGDIALRQRKAMSFVEEQHVSDRAIFAFIV